MLALKENNTYREYRTLNQDIYIGNNKIAQVWLGNKLIYPEDSKEINGDFYELDKLPNDFGNIYDTGINSSKDLEVEIIFKLNYNLDESGNTIQNPNLSTSRAFFGTHDKSSNSPSSTANSSYTEETKFHFIINGNYKIRFRYGNGDVELSPSLTEQEKLGIFWIKIYNDTEYIAQNNQSVKRFVFGCGDTVGSNEKARTYILQSKWNSNGNSTGGNLWVNGHNQGQSFSYINSTPPIVRKDSNNNPVDYGNTIKEDIARTKFFYVKLKKGNKFWEFIPQMENSGSTLIPDTGAANAAVYLKKYTYDNGYSNTTEKIFSFAYIKVNYTH